MLSIMHLRETAMSEAADAVAELAGQTQNLMDLMSSMQQ